MINPKNYFLLALILAALSFAAAKSAGAHQPRYVPDSQLVLIKNPAISQAFYGELKGDSAHYLIDLKQEQALYLRILVPDLPEIKKDKTVTVDYAPELGVKAAGFAKLDPASAPWENFHEEFAGDDYWQGPELKRPAEAGYYLIKVSSPDNTGKYVLVIGDKEEFPAAEIGKALIAVPQLKMKFYDKPVWQWFNGKVGKYFLLGLGLLLVVGFMFRKFHQVYK
ncbi:MAG: hypothetical protein Q7R92_02540 [bacterium]|nr:hypothetical protein [bacterium]